MGLPIIHLDSAGSGGGGGAGLQTKSGEIVAGAFAGNPKVGTVTFTTPFPDVSYSICVTPVTQNGTSYSWTIENKTVSSFVINMGANNINDLLQVGWIAVKHGETI